MGSVFIKGTEGVTRELAQVRVRDECRELQDILERNPNLIPGEQINPDDPRRWLIIRREMPIPDPNSGADRWSLDFVMIDQSAVLTFVECKRREDTRSRREVVGQVLEYAANAQFYWTADFLKASAETSAQQRGTTLDAHLADLRPDGDLSADGLFEAAVQNLKQGIVRLVFFLDEAPRELKSLADFLNRQMEWAEVLVVEAKQYTDGQHTIIVPRLFGFTEQVRIEKEVRREQSNTTPARRKWSEGAFFADAQKRLTSDQLAAVHALYDFAATTADYIDWGTGSNRGSFNAKYASACPRAPFSVYSDGTLQLNFGHLNGSVTATAFRDIMFRAFKDGKVFALDAQSLERFPPFSMNEWCTKAQSVRDTLARTLEEYKKTSNQASDATSEPAPGAVSSAHQG